MRFEEVASAPIHFVPLRYCQLVEVWRKGLKGTYRLGISIGRHRYQMLFAANIDSRSVGVD